MTAFATETEISTRQSSPQPEAPSLQAPQERPSAYELAESSWHRFHESLRRIAVSEPMKAYVQVLPILGGPTTAPWTVIFSARGVEADPARRKFLLQRCAREASRKGPQAKAARTLLTLLLWPELDNAFWRFHAVAPNCPIVAIFVADALKAALKGVALRARLDSDASRGGEIFDLEKEILGLTLYLADELVKDYQLLEKWPSQEAGHVSEPGDPSFSNKGQETVPSEMSPDSDPDGGHDEGDDEDEGDTDDEGDNDDSEEVDELAAAAGGDPVVAGVNRPITGVIEDYVATAAPSKAAPKDLEAPPDGSPAWPFEQGDTLGRNAARVVVSAAKKLPGLFPLAELGLALSPQRLFHFERAGDDEDGGPLVAIFQRDIVEIG